MASPSHLVTPERPITEEALLLRSATVTVPVFAAVGTVVKISEADYNVNSAGVPSQLTDFNVFEIAAKE